MVVCVENAIVVSSALFRQVYIIEYIEWIEYVHSVWILLFTCIDARHTHTHTHVIHATAADNAQSIRLNNFRRVCFVGLCCRFHILILLTLFVSIVSGISIFFGLLFYGCRCCGRMHAVGFQWDIFKLMWPLRWRYWRWIKIKFVRILNCLQTAGCIRVSIGNRLDRFGHTEPETRRNTVRWLISRANGVQLTTILPGRMHQMRTTICL